MRIVKILKVMALVVSFFLCSTLIAPNISFAEDVWCFSDGRFSFYLDSDTISGSVRNGPVSYSVSGKTVLDKTGEFHQVWIYGFASENDNLVGYMFNRRNGNWDYIGLLRNNSDLRAIWETMKPYMKQKGIHYSDSWT